MKCKLFQVVDGHDLNPCATLDRLLMKRIISRQILNFVKQLHLLPRDFLGESHHTLTKFTVGLTGLGVVVENRIVVRPVLSIFF
jgi:hypothetical protein